MTLMFRREGNQVVLRYTSGPVTLEISEDAGHMGHAWSQLGDQLNDHEKPVRRVPYAETVNLPEPEPGQDLHQV